MKLDKFAGVLITLLVALCPIILWWLFSPDHIQISTTTQQLDTLAKVTALSGLALLSFNIILSARLAIFERLFLGLDRAYRAHRLIGGTVLILLMVHAAAMTAKYSSISLLSGFEFLKPSTDLALMSGKIALGVMLILVSISIYIKVKYQWFITIQRILGATIFFGGFHALFVTGSDLRANGPLFAYFILLGGAAAGLYIYRSLFHKSVKRTLSYSVASVSFKEQVTVIWLRPIQAALAFYAGQFAFFTFTSRAVESESHPFSISSDSDSDLLRIAVKSSGDYTAELQNVVPGDLVEVEGPYGNFSYTKIQTTKQVWVAGGIGITPFLAMAQSLPSDHTATLYYCVQTIAHAIFLDELEKVAATKDGLTVILLCSDQDQRITAKEMVAHTAGAYLLCAPPAMMHSLEVQLKKLLVPAEAIYYEDFALL